MEPIQAQPAGDLELSSQASGAPEPEPQEPQGPPEPAAQEWLSGMGVKPAESAPEPRQARRRQEAPQPHPQDRLNEDFRARINRRKENQQLLETNRRQAEVIEKLYGLISPALEDSVEEAPKLPELPDPSTAEPIEFYRTVEERQAAASRAAIRAELEQMLGPALPVFAEIAQQRQREQEQGRRVEEARAAISERMEVLSSLEGEYAATEQGEGYYERVAAYIGAREQMLVSMGYPPQTIKGKVIQMLDGITQQALQHPAGPQHPAAYLDRVMQAEMPHLFNGKPAAQAHPPQRPQVSRTARELQQAASSGVTGSVGQQGRVTPAASDLQALIDSGKVNPGKLKDVLKSRNNGKMPTDLATAMARINEEVRELAAKRGRR